MFMQALPQTQVNAVLMQVGNVVNSFRGGGTCLPRKRCSSRVTSQPISVPETSTYSEDEARHLQKLEPDVEEFLSILTSKQSVQEVYMLWKQSCELIASGMNSYISGETFFENKTGFKESSLQTSIYRQPIMSFFKQNGPKLLMPQSAQFYQPSRGFLTGITETSKRTLGLRDKTSDKTSDKVTKIELGEKLEKGKNTTINIQVKGEESDGIWGKSSKSWLQKLFVIGLVYALIVLWTRNNGKLPGVTSLAPNNYEVNPEAVNVTFNDVKGIDEVREELEDIVQFLTNPEKFQSLGARLPKGVLLVGPPGVGKTLVAKAIAGEAGVPFFHASGSEFDEIFVGMGAKRVRQIFGSAKMRAPSIVFIDEIDAVGSKRVNSPFTPHANQTINQLLSEMDGFSTKDGVIVIGATNKKDSLDKALLRPGRFDLEIGVHYPDVKGRADIFNLYLKKVKKTDDLDVKRLAMLTYGLTGAEISNIVNQAALKAVKDNRDAVNMEDLLYARDKCTMGPEMKTLVRNEGDKYHTACHEAGHALVAHYTKNASPVNKITVMPRGASLGHTQLLLTKDFTHSRTKAEILAEIDVCMGGRVGEELYLGPENVSEGCTNDFERATNLAMGMVKRCGMSDKIGHRVVSGKDTSADLQNLCDLEVNRLLKEAYQRAWKLQEAHKVEHKRIVDYLMEHENIDKEEFEDILNGKIS